MSKFRELEKRVIDLIKKCGWDKGSPKDRALSVVLEASELLEIFQWTDEKNSDEMKGFLEKKKEHLSEEIADVAIYLIGLCNSLDIDLLGAIEDKATKNEKRFLKK